LRPLIGVLGRGLGSAKGVGTPAVHVDTKGGREEVILGSANGAESNKAEQSAGSAKEGGAGGKEFLYGRGTRCGE
jgi:hypothetical protein